MLVFLRSRLALGEDWKESAHEVPLSADATAETFAYTTVVALQNRSIMEIGTDNERYRYIYEEGWFLVKTGRRDWAGGSRLGYGMLPLRWLACALGRCEEMRASLLLQIQREGSSTPRHRPQGALPDTRSGVQIPYEAATVM